MKEMNFNEAVEFILKEEGGFVDHKSDPGGMTNFGISKRAYPDLDIKNLTKEDAAAIYKRDYWDKLPEFAGPLKFLAFDMAVNGGVKRAIILMQRAIGVPDDGLWGSMSIRAMDKHNHRDVAFDYTIERQLFYTRLGTFGVFGKGWMRRVLRAHEYAGRYF